MARPRLVDAYRGLASLLRAGLVVREAVAQLRDNGALPGTVGARIVAEVGSGRPLSEALALFPDEVPREDVALIEAGEATGNLDRSLDRLADRHDARRAARSRFVTEVLYPVVVFHVAAFLTPIQGALARDGSLFGASWLRTVALILVPGYALVGGALWLRRTDRGRALLRRIVDALPGFGSAARHRRRADLAVVLGAGYEAGMRIDRALELGGKAVEDPRVAAAAADVSRGRTLHDALASTGALPPQLLSRIAIGEKAGDLSRVFSDVAREEAEAADHILRRSLQMTARGFYIAICLWVLYYGLTTIAGLYSLAGV